jgi:hypothetical protein
MNCPQCQEKLPDNYSAESCPTCGCNLPARPDAKVTGITAREKSVCWVIFWLAFFGSPILGLLTASADAAGGILFPPILGAIIAGFALARIFTSTIVTFILMGVLFSAGVLVIYVAIIFVGCLVIMGHGGGF